MSLRARPAAAPPAGVPSNTGSMYGGAIDFKPNAVLGPSVTTLPAPNPMPTGVALLPNSNSFEVEFVLSKLSADTEADPQLKGNQDYTDRYALRVRVKQLADFAERKNFVLNGVRNNILEKSTRTTIDSYVDKDKLPQGETENGYQCGSPQSSWYQVSLLMKAEWTVQDLKEKPSVSFPTLADPKNVGLEEVAADFFGTEANKDFAIKGDAGTVTNMGAKYLITDDKKKYKWAVKYKKTSESDTLELTATVNRK